MKQTTLNIIALLLGFIIFLFVSSYPYPAKPVPFHSDTLIDSTESGFSEVYYDTTTGRDRIRPLYNVTKIYWIDNNIICSEFGDKKIYFYYLNDSLVTQIYINDNYKKLQKLKERK